MIENRGVFDRAGEAVMAKIMGNERAVAALAEEADAQSAIPAHHAPDLKQKG